MDSQSGKLGVCVIGLGCGIYHASTYNEMTEAVDLYVCDHDTKKVAQAQQELSVAGTFSSVEQVLASDAVDAVDLCLPHHLHCPLAIRAAEVGKHCMVEKPIALHLAEADEMIAAAERAGTRLAVAENYQFKEDSTMAGRLINEGRIGAVFMVQVREMWRINPRPGSWWFQKQTAGGGSLISLAIHSVRTLRLLAGARAEQVFALVSDMVSPQLSLEGEDTSMLLVKFCNGVMGSLVSSWATEWPGPGPRFTVHGTEGSIISEEKGPLVVHSSRPGLEPDEGGLRIEVARHQYNKDWFAEACRAFVQCLRTGDASAIDAAEGRKDLEIVEAAYRSAQSGQAVQLPIVNGEVVDP